LEQEKTERTESHFMFSITPFPLLPHFEMVCLVAARRAAPSRLSRIRAVEEHDRKILRQDLQDELQHRDLSPNGEGLFLMSQPLFHPVNPVNPVKIQFFNCIVPV
jgi:hypothetical protein